MSSTLGGKLGLTSSSTWDNVVTAITSATVSTILSFSAASTSSTSITFTWKNPASGGFAGIVIVGKTGSYPTSPTDGTVYYTGSGNNTTASGTASTSISKFTGGTTYYFRAWSYVLINNVKWYSDSYKGVTCTTAVEKGQKIFTTSGTFTVPTGVTSIDIFCVGGGGAGGGYIEAYFVSGYADREGISAGGGGGYTATKLKQVVTPGDSYTVTIGAGAAENNTKDARTYGGATSFGNILTANAGCSVLNTNKQGYVYIYNKAGATCYGGNGGSGGAGGGIDTTNSKLYSSADSGGYDGRNGNAYKDNCSSLSDYPTNDTVLGTTASEYRVGPNAVVSARLEAGVAGTANACMGQHSTTRAFGESSNTMYSGGGCCGTVNSNFGNNFGSCITSGGGYAGVTLVKDYSKESDDGDTWYEYQVYKGNAGTANTGGGGGGGSMLGLQSSKNLYNPTYSGCGGAGGSGICIVRWGY